MGLPQPIKISVKNMQSNYFELKHGVDMPRFLSVMLMLCLLDGCATYPGWLSSQGPSREQVQENRASLGVNGIQLVDVNDVVTRKLLSNRKQSLFSESFGVVAQSAYVIGAGDVIEVSVWEAQPAMLFGNAAIDPRMTSAPSKMTTFPEQMVSSEGTINIPFAGHVSVAGRNPPWIEDEIAQRLKGKANQPQVLVRVIRNTTSAVTVVGEVTTSARMPLTARGERLLDALASSGGVRQPVNKMTLQITRGDKVQAMPLDTIIRDPKQNVVLLPGDVITAMFQPLSFTVLGATGKNEEVNFEAQGISLAQALARAGGLNDMRADARGVFIFRFEDAAALDWTSTPAATPDGKVPVIYQVDLRDPSTFFVAQSFPVQNKDVIYVTNAPAAELQKFMNIVMTAIYPVVVAKSLKPNL
jgi:polysaccharide export outer membrane protein